METSQGATTSVKREKFWGRRFASISILDDAKMLERARYILSHGSKEGLVFRSKDWPGVNCVEALTKGKRLFGVWYDRTNEYEASLAGQEFSPGDFATRYEVPLTPLPCIQHLSPKEQQEKIKELVLSIQKEPRAGKVESVIKRLREIKTRSPEEQEKLDDLIRYYDTNASRMRYDEYIRLGYGIGSGAVESAHKQVVHARLRQAGMRWSENGARRLLALRVLLLNDNWSMLDRLMMKPIAA